MYVCVCVFVFFMPLLAVGLKSTMMVMVVIMMMMMKMMTYVMSCDLVSFCSVLLSLWKFIFVEPPLSVTQKWFMFYRHFYAI